MERVLPIVCQGYCLFSVSIVDENTPPAAMNIVTSDIARKLGYTTTTNRRFSHGGSMAWLCPACTQRWQAERQEKLEDLLQAKQRLHNRYATANDTERTKIIDVELRQLRNEFLDCGPTDEEWQKWSIL